MKLSMYKALAWLLARLGNRGLAGLGLVLGWFVWHVVGSRRRLATQAVAERLECEPDQAERIAKASFINSFKSFLDIVRLRYVDDAFIDARVTIADPGLYDRFDNHKGPIIAATGHYGSWEMMCGVVGHKLRSDKLVIMRRNKDKALNELMIHLRTLPKVRVVEHRRASKVVVDRLRQGDGIAAFLVDHNCMEKEALFLPFLGKIAAVNRGPAMLAVKTKALVVPLVMAREKGGRYTLYIGEFLDTQELAGSVKQRIEAVARFYTQAMESFVRKRPEQWFWMHRRWKTRPPGEPGE